MSLKGKLKFEDYKNCLKVTQLEKKTIWKKIKLTWLVLKNTIKNSQKNNTLILKSSQKFKRERHAFTEKVHRIILSSIDGKRIKSIDSVETFA